uniref:RZ-type domain-containing protein n=1 Tax=Dendroctonus ponderosae TaxID=77166 RepID=A0AAR5PM44_DENPD
MKRLIPDIQPNRKRMNSRNGNNRGHHSGHFYNRRQGNAQHVPSEQFQADGKEQFRSKPERVMGFKFVKTLVDNEDLQHVILTVSNDRNGFLTLLENKNITNDTLVLLVKLLWHISECSFHQSKIAIYYLVLKSRFIDQVKLYIGDIINQRLCDKKRNTCFWNNPDDFWKHLICFARMVLELIPTGHCGIIHGLLKHMTIFFPLIESTHSISITREIKDQTAHLLTVVEKTIEDIAAQKKIVASKDLDQAMAEPPDDFRQIEIIPCAQEILSDESPFLRPNIIDRPFSDINQYLDIQFRLLREDFVAPLRRGIKTFLRNESKPRKKWKKLESVKIYRPVRFLHAEAVNEYHCYKLQFDFGHKKRVLSYEHSKLFMFGSLVCLTRDNFQHFMFGTVVKRDPELLQQGLLVVGFSGDVQIDFDSDYLLMESKIYFEPYKQVLRALKQMRVDIFPMEKYIIKLEMDSNPPQYLRRIVDYQIEDAKFCPFEFPERSFHNFNESQLNAYKAALTNEFAIIQGPPGTGKTYLGLKVIHTLLRNRSVWYNKTPILVICYTNHALDQFLEGILSENDDIVRVGGQSKNKHLEDFTLSTLKRRTVCSEALFQKKVKVQKHVAQQNAFMDVLRLIDGNESILNFDLFNNIIANYSNTWFSRASKAQKIEWLLQGKNERGRRLGYKKKALDNMQSNRAAENTPGDLLEDETQLNLEMLDDIFSEIKFNTEKPLLSVEQLRDSLNRLIVELTNLERKPDKNVMSLLRCEILEWEIWETECNLDYLQDQLKYYQNPKNRRMPEHINLTRPFVMSYTDRWNLYFSWIDQYVAWVRKMYTANSIAFRNTFQVYQEMQEIENTQIMRQKMVVGITTTGAARFKSSIQALRCPIVIVEEAAEVLEAHIVASLTNNCQHLILIGDHLQLKPGAADYRMQIKYKLGISLFERMVLNNVTCHTLNVQHRMKPNICKLIRPHIYPQLTDHESTLSRPPILGVQGCLYFIDHQQPEELCQDESKKNVHESTFLIAFARYLILNGYKSNQITILATYLGQMFEMLHEKNKPINVDLLKDVRISVLDNYQGEESDIVLLSLVRSNTDNNIGFLRIQNRVCVALSRARNGLFIIGNMSILLNSNSENEIWKKVNTVLEEQNAIGSHLLLRCQIHPVKLTKVSKSLDFEKVSEGGCDMICNVELDCGHTCKRLCHIQDTEHKQYRCMEKCLKPLCNDELHVCLKQCYEDCGPCMYIVRRTLDPCGHEVDMNCHKDAEDFKCKELVHTKLPCEHEADKPCHEDPHQFKCLFPCDTRVEPCGHACHQTCHIRDDPDHRKYICEEPCAKSKVGCRQDPDEKHLCSRLCYQDCDECLNKVSRQRSCGHRSKIPCSLDVEEVDCQKPCKLKLPCGHECANPCSKACGPCKVKVEKTILDCGHSLNIECSVNPERKHCIARSCPRLLPCGHECQKKCTDQCTDVCTKLVDCSIESPCGHVIKKIECHMKSTSPKLLLKYCSEPCNIMLKCKHKCSGTCGECIQSRFHKRCAEKCALPLVCNHECLTPCRESCKPCTRPCEMRCAHSKCQKKCGAPCTPCKQMCERQCKHLKCTRRCGVICDVEPCTQRCTKLLKCGHVCVGFCGDPCPPLCRICDNEKLTEIFFGNEDEEDAVFVLLKDCGHVLESTGLESWMNEAQDLIQFKRCPKCSTNITTTQRFSDFVKKSIQDVSIAKRITYGANKENEELCRQLLRTLHALRDQLNPVFEDKSSILNTALSKLLKRLSTELKGRSQPINKIELKAIESKTQVLSYISNCFIKEYKKPKTDDPSILHVKLILDVLMRSEDHITHQEIDDLELEIKRLQKAVQFDSIKKSSAFILTCKSNEEVKALSLDIETVVFGHKKYSDDLDRTLLTQLKKLALKLKCYLSISEVERVQIVKAMGFPRGHWYKCPNGHPYCIGDCGGAIEKSVCFCGEAIGGTQHRLLGTNQLATEMDGATSSAWPGPLH